MVQASTAGDTGSIPHRGTKIPHATKSGQKKKKIHKTKIQVSICGEKVVYKGSAQFRSVLSKRQIYLYLKKKIYSLSSPTRIQSQQGQGSLLCSLLYAQHLE